MLIFKNWQMDSDNPIGLKAIVVSKDEAILRDNAKT